MYNDPAFRNFSLTPLAGALGAEIRGLDLARPFEPEVAEDLRKAFVRYHMIAVRDQKLDLDDYRRFARLFGEFSGNPIHVAIPGYPEFVRVVKEPNDTGPTFGGSWHTDLPWFERPPKATMLYAEEVPPYGGDTLYASMHLAYETLSERFRDMIDGLVAVHSGRNTYQVNAALNSVKVVDEGWEVSLTEVEHPLVQRHPDTGRPYLYVGKSIVQFKGMTPEESRPIVDYLMSHAVRPEFTCRLSWRAGTLAAWDNRCLLHHAIGDYPQFRRIVYRTTIAGERPIVHAA
jgi:alpha-ketoglutarate-dependent taurine dioxygenase